MSGVNYKLENSFKGLICILILIQACLGQDAKPPTDDECQQFCYEKCSEYPNHLTACLNANAKCNCLKKISLNNPVILMSFILGMVLISSCSLCCVLGIVFKIAFGSAKGRVKIGGRTMQDSQERWNKSTVDKWEANIFDRPSPLRNPRPKY